MNENGSAIRGIAKLVLILIGALAALVAGYLGFIVVPGMTDVSVWSVVLVLLLGIAGLFVSRNIARSILSEFNTAKVRVKGPIMRDSKGVLPGGAFVVPSSSIVEQIERADKSGYKALVLNLNTPGGQVLPSDDIRKAVERFDGLTVGYATDVCASGGYWIASSCDRFFARDLSLIGSIGVLGSRVTMEELADNIGVSYEQIKGGKYKDAGTPLKELEDHEREYFQGLVDEYYDAFIERVADNRDLSEDEIRGTEARVYLGEEAEELGLIDEVGTLEDVEDYLEEELGEKPQIMEINPSFGLKNRITVGLSRIGYSIGVGVASVFSVDRDIDIRFSLK